VLQALCRTSEEIFTARRLTSVAELNSVTNRSMNRRIMTVAHPPRSPARLTYSTTKSRERPWTTPAPAARPHPDEQFVSADHLWHEIAVVVRTALSRSALSG